MANDGKYGTVGALPLCSQFVVARFTAKSCSLIPQDFWGVCLSQEDLSTAHQFRSQGDQAEGTHEAKDLDDTICNAGRVKYLHDLYLVGMQTLQSIGKRTHRHVVFSAINPPAIGPRAGPANGARVYMDIASLYYEKDVCMRAKLHRAVRL